MGPVYEVAAPPLKLYMDRQNILVMILWVKLKAKRLGHIPLISPPDLFYKTQSNYNDFPFFWLNETTEKTCNLFTSCTTSFNTLRKL